MLKKIATISCPKDSIGEKPKGKEFEYRVIAINKSSEGQASNMVMVVL